MHTAGALDRDGTAAGLLPLRAGRKRSAVGRARTVQLFSAALTRSARLVTRAAARRKMQRTKQYLRHILKPSADGFTIFCLSSSIIIVDSLNGIVVYERQSPS
jgi:hypothetical protein